jgi:hypothetical protein
MELHLPRMDVHLPQILLNFPRKPVIFPQKTSFLPIFRMIPVNYDSGIRFGDPNLRWGNPSYLLEPGDPGYVPPTPDVSEPKTKSKKMKHQNWYPLKQTEQIVWLSNFLTKLPGYATVLGLTTGQVTAAVADCHWLEYILELWLPAVRTFSLACTSALAEAERGTGTAVQVLPVFTPPALPPDTVAVAPGALTRIFALVQSIKNGGKTTDTINTNLGIVGSEAAAVDLTTVQPVISAKANGSQVQIKWGWQGNSAALDSCEIQVDRGTGTFALLTIDTTPNYTDTQAWPGTKTIWTYKAIYRAADAQVGHWSQTVSVTVGG